MVSVGNGYGGLVMTVSFSSATIRLMAGLEGEVGDLFVIVRRY